MNAGEHDAGCGEITQYQAREELERLLGDPRFHATERARKILRYVAEQCFNGEAEGVKAYAIALDVLNRPARFDSNSDPIVRIELSRLRGALSNYYEAFGSELDITIHLPVGRYLTIFTRCKVISKPSAEEVDEADDYVEPAEREAAEQAQKPSFKGRRLKTFSMAGIAALLVVGTASTGIIWLGKRPAMTERPSVILAMSSADEEYAKEADTTEDYLVTALSRFRTLNISSQKAMTTASISPRTRTVAGSSYEIEMKYYAADDNRTVWWQVVDTRGGGILKSGIDKVDVGGRSDAMVRNELVSILAKRFASTRGVVNLLEARDGAAANALGNTCVLKAEYELDEGGSEGVRTALSCLEQTVALQPGNTDALAVLSRALIAAEGGDPATTPFDRALTLANRATSLEPSSDRAQVALMMAQFYIGHSDAAIAAGNQALALNPNNPDVLSKLAAVLYSSGYRDAAVSLAEDAGKNVDAVPRDARIVLSLDSYARGDYSDASLVSEQINCSDFVVRAIRAASLGEMASPGARGSIDYLKAALPDYQTSLRTWMERRRYPAPIIASLERGLAKAEQMK